MPCSKCNADFNLLNWKTRCYECEEHYCSKCLTKVDGDSFCDICEILVERPPIKTKLMELKSKDLQQYLNKHNISTRGIVEKQELVELFYRTTIPGRDKKRSRRFNCSLSGSVPNLAQRSQTYLNNLRSTAEAAFNSRNWPGGQSAHTTPVRSPQISPDRPAAGSSTDEIPVWTPSQTQSRTNVPRTQPREYQPYTPPDEESEASPSIPRKYPKLSDFSSISELNVLSVKQLKELLSLNRVDYKGCVEKAELLERANRLWIDANIRREVVAGDADAAIEEVCKICMDAPLDCVLLECGHMATCTDCGKRLAECPICRQYVTRVVRTFKA